MKRTSILLALVVLTIFGCLQAQTQSGVVKTRGRMVGGNLVPGTPLTGATVQVDGRQAMLSKDGKFSFPVKDGKYTLKSVTKQGYSLIDVEACRSYNYSKNPLTIVMESPEQQQQDKLTAERKIRRQLQDRLREKEDAIEALLEQNRITEEQYRKQLQELYSEQQNNEKLIADMAKQYSELDYDQLDEFQRQVSYCIENGQLAKADSLLRSQGDMNKQVEESLKAGAALQQQRDQLKKAEAVHAAKVEEMARRCYSFYEMFLLQHQNDSAAHYLELRASLDTTNVEWQMDAGKFIEEYLADVDAASEYYHRSLRQALPINNGLNNDVAKVFDAMTKICKKKGQYNEMMQYSQKSLVVRKSLFGEKDPSIATSYLNIANSNCDLGNHDLALKQFDTVLNIVTYANSDVSDLEAKAYYGMGKVYNYYKNNLEKALWCYEMQKKSLLKNTKANEPRMIKCYDRLSELYMYLGEFDKSMEYNKKAMGIVMEHYGDNHPETADLIGSRGKCHLFKGELKEALDDLNQSYDKLRFFYGDDNAKVADALGLIAYVYFSSGDFDAAVKKEMMVLKTHLKTLGEKHKATAYDYLFLASYYEGMNDFDNALEYAEKSLEIYKQTIGEENEETLAAQRAIEEIKEKRSESGWRDNG